MLRKIEAVDLDGVTPSPLKLGYDDNGTPEPTIEWGDPATLWVDPTYQRDVSAGGLALIKRVAKGRWDWRKFKLPVVTMVDHDGERVRVVIDGQHTAIMAVSRGVNRTPWVVVQTVQTSDAAKAFIGQNKDRTAIGAMQEYQAALVAGDETALTIQQVLERADVTLCMWNKPVFAPGETLALGTIRTLINRRFAAGAGRVLRIVRGANVAPISADHIKAVEELVFGADFTGTIKDEKLTHLLTGELGAKMISEAGMFAAQHRVQKWKGLTTVLYRNRARVG